MIVRSYILNNLTKYMRESGYTLKKILLEISKIKSPDMHSENKVCIVNPPTKVQREIYDLLQIELHDCIKDDETSFEKMGVSYEEKAFYDILVHVRDTHNFVFEDEKCVDLAKKIKLLVDDKLQYANFFNRDDIKSQLNQDLTVLLYKNGYPPEWDEEVFEKVMEQAENFKRYN